MRLRLLPLSLLIALGATAPTWADASLPVFGADEELPSVLTATRLRQSLLDVPAAVTIIDRQMIEQSGVREIPELLRLVPGMVVGYDVGSHAFVSLHGTSADLARRMQVQVDGRSIYQPNLASVDWIGLPLDLADIDRIEVVRGPSSAAHGANSFFGVVNIITRHPADLPTAQAYYRQGQDGIQDSYARLAGNAGGVMDWRLSLHGRSDDGFTHNARNDGPLHDSKELSGIYGRGVLALEAGTLDLSFGYAGMSAEQPYRRDIYVETPTAELRNGYVSAAWEQDINAQNRLRAQLSHSQFKRHEPWEVMIPPLALSPEARTLWLASPCLADQLEGDQDFGACGSMTQAQGAALNAVFAALGDPDRSLLGEDVFYDTVIRSREKRTQLELQNTWVANPDFRLVYGLGLDHAHVNSETYLGGSEDSTLWRLSAHGEWRMAPAWLLNLGASQEFDEISGSTFSPRAAVNWLFTNGQVLRLLVSKAVRTPDILEESANWEIRARTRDRRLAQYDGSYFRNGVAPGNAPTEKILSHELGYFGQFDAWQLSLDARLFYDRLKLAEHQLDIDNFEIRQLQSHTLQGSELSLAWRPLASQRLLLNYANLEITGENENTDFVPQHSGSLGWWQDYRGGWQLGTTYYFYNNLRDYLYFDRLDLRLAKRLTLGRQQLELAAVMQTRLTDDAELRRENGSDRQRGWFSVDWRY